MKSKWFRWSCLITLIVVMLGADALAAKTEIVFWYTTSGTNAKVLTDLIDRYNKSQNEITLVGQYQGSYEDVVTKLTAAIPAKTQPCLVQMDLMYIPHFIEMGIVEPMDKYLTKTEKAAYIPAFLNSATYKKQLWSLPFANSVCLLFYNKDLFRAAGLNPDKPPKTWSEVIDYAKKLTKDTDNDGKTDQWGYFLRYTNEFEFQQLIMTTGGAVAGGADGKKITWNSPEGQRALQFIVDLVHKYKVMPLLGTAGGAQTTSFQDLFYAGKLAMTFNSSAGLAGFETNTRADFGTAFPPVDKKRLTVTGGSNVLLLKGVPKGQSVAAVKFLKWFSSKAITTEWAKETGYLPVQSSALPEMREYAKKDPRVLPSLDALQYLGPRTSYMGPEGPRVHNLLRDAISEAVYGTNDVKKALDESAVAAQKIVNSFVSPFKK